MKHQKLLLRFGNHFRALVKFSVRDLKGDSSDVMVVKYAPEDNGNKSEVDLLENTIEILLI